MALLSGLKGKQRRRVTAEEVVDSLAKRPHLMKEVTELLIRRRGMSLSDLMDVSIDLPRRQVLTISEAAVSGNDWVSVGNLALALQGSVVAVRIEAINEELRTIPLGVVRVLYDGEPLLMSGSPGAMHALFRTPDPEGLFEVQMRCPAGHEVMRMATLQLIVQEAED
jgi:hypothetical protein